MSAFTWDPCFVTGLAEVDDQHRQLVELINRFSELMLAGTEIAFGSIAGALDDLSAYAVHHFQEEERLMQSASLDVRSFDEHRALHHMFIAEVVEMRSGLGSNGASARALLDFLVHWLAHHILGADQAMARQLATIRSGISPSAAYDIEHQHVAGSTDPLVRALNGLFALVSVRNAELQALNRSLEEKVAERTSDLALANRRLESVALTDVLTGLGNRRHALSRIEGAWKESMLHAESISVMMLDADHFKEINDTFGHDAGDEVLRRLARTLSGAMRTDDLVFRLGGDEFLILCPRTGLEGAVLAAENVRAAVEAPHVQVGTGAWDGSVSIGVAERTAETLNPAALIRAADEALYIAKHAGRNCVATGVGAVPRA